MVGTEEYVSPEMLNDYDCGVEGDLWALGVIAFQMLAGKTPFKAFSKNDTFENILMNNYKFPASFNVDTRDLIKQLL